MTQQLPTLRSTDHPEGIGVMLRMAARYITRRLLQSLLFVLGVALGVAVVIAIDIANGSALRAFDLSAESVTGRATHQITGGPAGLATELYRQIRVDLGLRESAPVVTDYVRSPQLGDTPLRLLGVDPFAEPPFRGYLSTLSIDSSGSAGGAFEALNMFVAEPGQVLLSASLAERYEVQAGDTITLQPGGRPVEVRVVGLLQPDDSTSSAALDDLLLVDIATAQEITNTPGRLTRIDLILPEGADMAAIEALLPDGAQLVTVNAANSTIRQMTAAFELNLQALSLLALVVGVFLIYNTVTFSVVQRRPVIGVLRALGATRRQIFTLILGEAALLGFVGTVFGLGLGIIFGRAAVGLVSQTISDLYFTVNVQRVTVDPLTLLKGAGVGLLASLIAALLPSSDATSTPPSGTLRRSDTESRARRLLPYLTLGALALLVLGALILQLPVGGFANTVGVAISFAGLFCIVLGGALLTPLALLLLLGLLTPLTSELFGVPGRMAPRAVTRSLSRTAVAVAALTVAVSVIVGVSVMIASFRQTVGDWLESTLGADLYISAPSVTANRASANLDPGLVAQIAALPGINRVSASREVQVAAPDHPDLPPVMLVAVDFDISARTRGFVWLREPDYRAALSRLPSAGQAPAILVSEAMAYRRGITQQQPTLRLLTDRGLVAFDVIGVYYDYSSDQGVALMYRNVYQQYWDDPLISALGAFVTGSSIEAAQRTVQEALAGTDLLVQSQYALRSGVFEVFDRAFSITIALRLLATLVAFIGILSAMLSLQLEQARQYGTLRAVGMTPAQLWRFVLLQTGLMGITAGLLAMPVGYVLALVLIDVINVRSFGWTMRLTLQPDELAQAFAVAVVAALLAGIYPAWRLGRVVIAQAVRSE